MTRATAQLSERKRGSSADDASWLMRDRDKIRIAACYTQKRPVVGGHRFTSHTGEYNGTER